MEARLQILEMNHEDTHLYYERRHHRHHRHASRTSQSSYGHYEERCQNVAKPYLPYVKLPSFSGEGDPNVYLGWEAKVDQFFHVHEVLEDQRVRLASLEFMDYAMQWWHKTLMDIGLNKRPPVVSWDDLKACMRARFVPPHFKKDLLLKLQRLHQGTLSVDDYFKELDMFLIKVDMHESDEAKMARFVSGLRREIQDVVELHEYSSLETLVHLAIKVESQIARKILLKILIMMAITTLLGKSKINIFQNCLLKTLLSNLEILRGWRISRFGSGLLYKNFRRSFVCIFPR